MKNKCTFLVTLLAFLGCFSLHAQSISNFKISTRNPVNFLREKTEITLPGTDSAKRSVYITPEIIWFKYLALDRDTLEQEVKAMESGLYNNAEGDNGQPRLANSEIEDRLEIIEQIKDSLSVIYTKQDSLYKIYVSDFIRYDRCLVLQFTPKRSEAFFDMLYSDEGKRFRVLGSAGINFGNNTGSIFSEVVSGNLGLFRASLGTMVSAANSDGGLEAKQDEAFQRLATYGGNTVLNLEYPLAYLHTRNNQYNLISRFLAKGTADLPAFGTNTDTWAGSASWGMDIYADAATRNNELRFFVGFNVNRIYGTDVFRENLGIDNANFTFGQVSAGLVIMESIKISLAITSFSSEANLRNRNMMVGGQVLRSNWSSGK